jgi:hypothetical protein
MLDEAGPTDADGFLRVAGAAVLFRQLREDDRRRVLIDPAPEFLDARIVRRHAEIRPMARP